MYHFPLIFSQADNVFSGAVLTMLYGILLYLIAGIDMYLTPTYDSLGRVSKLSYNGNDIYEYYYGSNGKVGLIKGKGVCEPPAATCPATSIEAKF